MKRQRDPKGIRLKKGDTSRARRVSTPPMHERKRSYRAHCKAMAAGGQVNDASGHWRAPYGGEESAAKNGREGAKLRGGATRSHPRPHFEIYEKKLVA